MRYKIFSNEDDTMFVKSLNPLELASEFEAQIFSRKEIDRVMYKYGLEDMLLGIFILEILMLWTKLLRMLNNQ